MQNHLHALTLARAASIVGGVDTLARDLSIPSDVLARYMNEELTVPMDVFLRATEIVTKSTVADARRSVGPDQKAGA
jgi:hypothetical protein